MLPSELREKIRRGEWTGPTSGLCPGYTQANLVILPKEYAEDFKEFCRLNPKPCPVLEILEAGQTQPKKLVAEGTFSDVRTDFPKYRIYRKGVLQEEVTDATPFFDTDETMVSFFIGCSFSFEQALMREGVPVRNIEEGRNVSMYKTNIKCANAGRFKDCPLVVSMRPIPKDLVQKAIDITARFVTTHGAPVHVGSPEAIGIDDLGKVDFGEAVTIREGEVPVFWACGVTATMAAITAGADITITHAPGHMYVSDIKDEEDGEESKGKKEEEEQQQQQQQRGQGQGQ